MLSILREIYFFAFLGTLLWGLYENLENIYIILQNWVFLLVRWLYNYNVGYNYVRYIKFVYTIAKLIEIAVYGFWSSLCLKIICEIHIIFNIHSYL